MSQSEERTIVIDASNQELYSWRDLWLFRELLFFMSWRDILVRYKQTVIGIAWSVLRPFLTMIAFTIVFGKLAKLPSDGTPYPILVYSALLPWQFFSLSLGASSNSLIANGNMLAKVYFPRLIVPISSIMVCLVDFFISFCLLLLLMLWYQVVPSWRFVFLPLLLLMALMAALSFGLWLSALNVKYRDFRYVVPFLLQFGLYLSPVGFSSSVVPKKWLFLYSLNPMVGVIDGFRWAITGNASIYWPGFFISIVLILTVFYFGLRFFRNTERYFADVI